jgi:hypothetical protein
MPRKVRTLLLALVAIFVLAMLSVPAFSVGRTPPRLPCPPALWNLLEARASERVADTLLKHRAVAVAQLRSFFLRKRQLACQFIKAQRPPAGRAFADR